MPKGRIARGLAEEAVDEELKVFVRQKRESPKTRRPESEKRESRSAKVRRGQSAVSGEMFVGQKRESAKVGKREGERSLSSGRLQ